MLINVYTLIAFIVGSFVGSFLNLVSDRLETHETLVKGRSHCDHCKRNLTAIELIPIFSFLIHHGKSTCCKKKLSWYYPISELVTGIGFAFIAHQFVSVSTASIQNSITFIFLLAIFCIYVVIMLSDMKFRIIPDKLILTGLVLTLLFLFLQTFLVNYTYYVALKNDTFGVYLIESGFFTDRLLASFHFILNTLLSTFGIWLFFIILILVTKGRGMGGGDAKLGILIGLVNGFPLNILAIFLGFILGAIYSLVFLITRKTTLKDTIPFGPFLVMGSVVAFFWGNLILRWYLGF